MSDPTPQPPTVHASAVLVGGRAVLIRGPSGAGKSRLAFDLIVAGRTGAIPPALLVGDDRVHLAARGAELWVRPAAELAGLIEIRGLGLRRLGFAPEAVVGLVVDLAAPDAERLPPPELLRTSIEGIRLARIPVAAAFSPLALVVAAVTTTEASGAGTATDDCPKGFSNHIDGSIELR